jgi:hypothetical protein
LIAKRSDANAVPPETGDCASKKARRKPPAGDLEAKDTPISLKAASASRRF